MVDQNSGSLLAPVIVSSSSENIPLLNIIFPAFLIAGFFKHLFHLYDDDDDNDNDDDNDDNNEVDDADDDDLNAYLPACLEG